MNIIDRDKFIEECTFKTSRSGGKGGQNVNKVETKVELIFDIRDSALFTAEEKEILLQKLASSIRDDRYYYTTCDKERSQVRNKEYAVDKAIRTFQKALHVEKPRKKTKPSMASKELRLKSKQINAFKKANRQKFSDDF